MGGGDFGLLEGSADLAEGLLLAQFADLIVNGAGGHGHKERETTKNDRGDGDGLATGGEAALNERMLALRADERGVRVGDGDALHAIGEEAIGVVGAFASMGHGIY